MVRSGKFDAIIGAWRKRYRELDEVRAPAEVPEAGVKAGDRGVVLIEEFGSPNAAIEVEFAGRRSWPDVIYSPDLSEVYSHHHGYGS